VNKKFRVQRVSSPDIPGVDCILANYFVDNITCIFVCVVYILPASPISVYQGYFDNICSVLSPESNILIGDYNIRDVTGTDFDFLSSTSICHELYFFINFSNLKSLNFVRNTYGKILDLVLSNIVRIFVTREHDSIVPEDVYHPALLAEFLYTKRIKNATKSQSMDYNFSKANYEQLYRAIESGNIS